MIAVNEHPPAELTIAEAIERWPQIAPLFLQHRLACVGCDLAGFCTFGDIGTYYAHVELPAFLAKMQDAIQGRPGS